MLAIDRRSLTDRSSRPVSPSYRGVSCHGAKPTYRRARGDRAANRGTTSAMKSGS